MEIAQKQNLVNALNQIIQECNQTKIRLQSIRNTLEQSINEDEVNSKT